MRPVDSCVATLEKNMFIFFRNMLMFSKKMNMFFPSCHQVLFLRTGSNQPETLRAGVHVYI